MYWSIVTLFTTGYGDIYAHNSSEQWCAMFVIVVGSIMTAYLVGKVTSLVFEGDSEDQYLREKMDEAYSFCTHYGLSNPLIRAITAHIEYSCQYNYIASDPNDFLKSLPNHLRIKVEKQIASRAIRRIDFLEGLDDTIMGNIRISLKSIGCNAGYKLFSEGDRSSDIYMVRIGCARLYFGENDPNKDKGSRLLKRGDVFGEYCIVSPTRTSTLVCDTWCEFYTLKAETIKEIIWDHLHEHEANEAWKNIEDILERTRDKFRNIPYAESDKLLKFKAKNDVSDTVYDDLFSVDHKEGFGFLGLQEDAIVSQRSLTNIKDEKVKNVSDFVDGMRRVSRVDSGLKDMKLKQHYKKMRDQNGRSVDKSAAADAVELEVIDKTQANIRPVSGHVS